MRLGLIAAARITGPALIEPARLVDDVEVVAIAARSVDDARQKASEWDVPVVHPSYDALLADPAIDAVYFATPAALHHRWTLAALAAGKHVLCEKPFSANATEAREMVAAADAAGLVLVEAYHWRYHPIVGRLRQLLDDRAVGEVEHVHGSFCLPEGHIPADDIRWDLSLGGGGLMDLGCYPLQWLRWVLGAEPEVISASAECPVPEVDGRFRADLRWELPTGPVTGSIESSMIGPELDIHLLVTGTECSIRVTNPLAPQHGARIEVGTPDGTDDVAVQLDRRKSMRNLLGTLLVSAGVPMLTMGDEFGRSQRGNNNAYCQDSALTWMRWERRDWQDAFLEQTRRLLQLRREHPALRPLEYGQTGQRVAGSSRLDWWNAAGLRMTIDDWDHSHDRTMQMLAESTPMEEPYSRVLVIFHGSPRDTRVTTPVADGATALELLWDSAADHQGAERVVPGDAVAMTAMSMRVYAVHGMPAAGAPAPTVMRLRAPASS